MRTINKLLFLIVMTAVAGCRQSRHSDACTDACLAGSDAEAIAHLTARLEENRAELEKIDDPALRYVILEIISGLEAHIDYIKAGRSRVR